MTKEPSKWVDNYWADFIHLEGGKMIAVVEGFETLEEAVEFVEKAKSMGVKFRRRSV